MTRDLPTLSWIDFSERDRRRMLDVVDLFRVHDTRDELGVGSIRDGISDALFPGTSTIMTRARYFLFVPWIYARRERIIRNAGGNTAKSSVAQLGRGDETELMRALKSGGEVIGVIGRDVGIKIKRLPSSVYWFGLERWGIKRFPGSTGELHRWLERFDPSRVRSVLDDDNTPVGDAPAVTWHPALPDEPDDLLTRATFDLTPDEAVFLKERILAECPGTVLAHLVSEGTSSADPSAVRFPWEHHELAILSAHNRAQLEHARSFSAVIHGAGLLYNLMLAEEVRHSEWADDYRARLDEWARELREIGDAVERWRLDELFAVAAEGGGTVPQATRLFLSTWLDHVRRTRYGRSIPDDKEARRFIHSRERRLKGGRARLGNPSRLGMWGGESGTARHDFRWSTVRTIIDDIQRGLERDSDRVSQVGSDGGSTRGSDRLSEGADGVATDRA